jgi:hypothetical protein
MKWMNFAALSALLAATALPNIAQGKILNPAISADAISIMKRAQCGPADGKPAIFYWTGKVYSRVPGEPDRLLFSGDGMNVRQCTTVTDPVRGTGYRQVSRELMTVNDPVTGEILREWKNPWTGETVEVLQIANDPVNMPPMFPLGRDGKPVELGFRQIGNYVMMPMEIPLRYHNVLGGDYQAYIGGQYHAMEIFDFIAPASEILNDRVEHVAPSIAWVRISDWLPWMKMGGRSGQLVFNAVGTKLKSFDELPARLRQEIADHYPDYQSPPPMDDARPNETSWTVFKKWVDAKSPPSADGSKGHHP